MQTRLFRLLLIVAAFLATGSARAQDIAAGNRIAQASCSGCHLVNPQKQTKGSDAAPTFVSIARMPSTTAMSLAAFLTTPHANMPNLILNRKEIRDVSAYILNLRNSL